jgi:hypothetical protein
MDAILLTDDVASLRGQVQKAIIEIITKGLESGNISEEKAKSMAQFILEKLPENISYDDFFKVLPKLDDNYPEFAKVVLPFMEQVELKNKARTDIQITELLKTGKIDEALNLTNQAIDQEKNLS